MIKVDYVLAQRISGAKGVKTPGRSDGKTQASGMLWFRDDIACKRPTVAHSLKRAGFTIAARTRFVDSPPVAALRC